MASKTRIHKQIPWTAEDRARHKTIREKFQKERPSQDQLLAGGEYEEFVPLGLLLEMHQAIRALKKSREEAGLSLAEVASRSGIDKAALSRLENGRQANPTMDTLWRYAKAIGKEIMWVLRDHSEKTGSGR